MPVELIIGQPDAHHLLAALKRMIEEMTHIHGMTFYKTQSWREAQDRQSDPPFHPDGLQSTIRRE